MASQWYYTIDGEQGGPVGSPQLKQLSLDGKLRPDDYVWKEGLPNWVAAKKVRGLFSGPSSKSQPEDEPPETPVAKPVKKAPANAATKATAKSTKTAAK